MPLRDPFATTEDDVSRETPGDPGALAQPADPLVEADHDPDRPGAQATVDWYGVPIDGRLEPVLAPSPEAAAIYAVAQWQHERHRAPTKVGSPQPLTPRQASAVLARIRVAETDHRRIGSPRPTAIHRSMVEVAQRGPGTPPLPLEPAPEPPHLVWRYFRPYRIVYVLGKMIAALIYIAIATAGFILRLYWAWDAPILDLANLDRLHDTYVLWQTVATFSIGGLWLILWMATTPELAAAIFHSDPYQPIDADPRVRDYRDTRTGRK